MLGFHGVGRDGADYYLSDPAREVPVPLPGRWSGTAATGLGLVGPLRPQEFRTMLEGIHPRTGLALGTGRAAVAGFDLTFSTPKSASVLFALGGPEAASLVVDAHLQAVAGALSYLERHALSSARRSGHERLAVATTGMIAGQFTHAVNRNNDPHVHSHVVMANLVHGVDGRWSACDRRGIAAHRQAASAVYDAHLRAVLTAALGVRWAGGPGRPAEVVGVPPELLGEFSSRAADIRRRRHEVGARSMRGARIAWAATRPAKEPAAPYRELTREWERRASAAGRPELELRAPPAPDRPLLDEHRFASVISLTPHGGARRRDVVAGFGAAAPDGIAADALERLVDRWVPPAPAGVAEPIHWRRDVVPAGHVLRVLGPRPLRPADHEVWVGAAAEIAAFRSRWGLTHSPEPLGEAGPRSLSSLPAARLADHVRTARHLTEARARLGLREPSAVELSLGR